MKATGNSEQQSGRGRMPRITGWVVILAGLTFGAGYLYYLHQEDEKVFANTHYFLILQEVATEFNNNLDQLVRLHEYEQSKATILSIFSSYMEDESAEAAAVDESTDDVATDAGTPGEAEAEADKDKDKDKDEGEDPPDSKNEIKPHDFSLVANRARIEDENGNVYSVDIRDLMPATRNDFVLYVIADSNNRVVSSTGGASGLSMIDTEEVSRAIQMRDNQDWLKLATKQGIDTPEPDKSLPGYSTQIDVELNTGTSRLFILPFHLHHKFSVDSKNGIGQGVPLYLVGIQPENVIDSHESKRWNLSLLLLSLVALVFLWTFTRLLMLSRHQPLGNGFYRITVVASYSTFILLVALLLAFAHRNSEIAIKEDKAKALMESMRVGVSEDLYAIFTALEDFHRFYSELLPYSEDGAATDSCKGEELSTPEGINDCVDRSSESENLQGRILFEADKQLEVRKYAGYATMDISDFCAAADEAAQPDELPQFTKFNVYWPGTRVCLDPSPKGEAEAEAEAEVKVSNWFEQDLSSLPAEGRLLSVFLMNGEGRQVLPTFYFTESNQVPTSYTLAHRDYFRRVRDQYGWSITLKPGTTNESVAAPPTADCPDGCEPPDDCCKAQESITRANFYIQRLLNLNTGTRGSTIGMPLNSVNDSGGANAPSRHILGADIVLPSLSLSEWHDSEALQDMVVMVIDRISGEVLFHMGHKRSLVESLFRAGWGAADIRQSISAGRFETVPGYYHGESGTFLATPLPITQWVAVVFVPDAGTDSLMTNTFLVCAFGMGAALLLLTCLFGLLRRYIDTDELKIRWGVPTAVNRHGIMLFSSILITSVYMGYWLGEIISQQTVGSIRGYSLAFSLLAVAAALVWGRNVLQRLRRQDRLRAELEINANRGIKRLIIIFFVTGLGTTIYLQYIGNMPDQEMSWYYENLYEARLNQEKMELQGIALTRYPNSIGKRARNPLSMLPISPKWCLALSERPGDMKQPPWPEQEHVLPEHVGTFSQYTASTDAFDWAKTYLLGLTQAREVPDDETKTTGALDRTKLSQLDPFLSNPDSDDQTTNAGAREDSPLPRFITFITAVYLLLCGLWYLFYRRVIGARLVGPPGLIEHLQQIVKHNVPERAYAPRPGLVLDLHCQRHAGDDLSALLLRCALDSEVETGDATEPVEQEDCDIACQGVAMLLRECPWLKPGPDDLDPFPGANISFSLPDAGMPSNGEALDNCRSLGVRLSDLDACLSNAKLRNPLLRLIRHLKAMCLAGKLAELRVILGFHSYEALLLKAHNIKSDRDPMTEAEFADWAQALMDFTVELPKDLTGELDADFVAYECRGSGLLRGLPEDLPGPHHINRASWNERRRRMELRDVDKTGREWASVNCILLKAGALFRHKWETCSSAEKLALYFLAKGKRVNTANAQLLEQLALLGLIRVDHGGIRIVNNSFAYFARHAEDTSTLKHLVEIGGASAWQEFRLPVTLVVLLLLGGIAFTSGSSLYLIAASMLGLLGTIGSLTSSAHMIRGNLR